MFPEMISGRHGGAETAAAGFDEHRPLTPPPDLPSLMLDSRIVYLGMPVNYPVLYLLISPLQLVSAVTELIIAELFYLQYKDATKPVYLYINSSGTTRADGEVVGFETEGMAIFDTMEYIKNDVSSHFLQLFVDFIKFLCCFILVSFLMILPLFHFLNILFFSFSLC